MTWHDTVTVHDLPRGGRKHLEVDGKQLSLIHTDEGVFCIDFRCPHTGGPLGEGIVDRGLIACPLHKWKFDLRDGTHNRAPTCPPASVYPLRLEGEMVQVELGGSR